MITDSFYIFSCFLSWLVVHRRISYGMKRLIHKPFWNHLIIWGRLEVGPVAYSTSMNLEKNRRDKARFPALNHLQPRIGVTRVLRHWIWCGSNRDSLANGTDAVPRNRGLGRLQFGVEIDFEQTFPFWSIVEIRLLVWVRGFESHFWHQRGSRGFDWENSLMPSPSQCLMARLNCAVGLKVSPLIIHMGRYSFHRYLYLSWEQDYISACWQNGFKPIRSAVLDNTFQNPKTLE